MFISRTFSSHVVVSFAYSAMWLLWDVIYPHSQASLLSRASDAPPTPPLAHSKERPVSLWNLSFKRPSSIFNSLRPNPATPYHLSTHHTPAHKRSHVSVHWKEAVRAKLECVDCVGVVIVV